MKRTIGKLQFGGEEWKYKMKAFTCASATRWLRSHEEVTAKGSVVCRILCDVDLIVYCIRCLTLTKCIDFNVRVMCEWMAVRANNMS